MRAKKLLPMIIVAVFSVFCVLPLVITVLSSFMSFDEMNMTAHLIPRDFTLRQFEEILLKTPQYLIWFWNSFKITFLTIALAIPLSLMAAYGFSKFRFPGRDLIFFIYIIVMLMPFQATLVPQYITLKSFGLLDQTASVILPNAFSAFGAFLMTQFMKGIDNEIIEAAKIDGMNNMQIFLRIIVPLSRPAVSALFILLFIESWSMIEQPMIFLSDPGKLPLSLYLGNIASSLYAGGTVFLILPLLIYLFGYEDLLEGISLGSVK